MKETNTKNEVGKKDKEVRKIPAFGGKGPSRIRQSFGRGLTIFLVIAACIILYFAFLAEYSAIFFVKSWLIIKKT